VKANLDTVIAHLIGKGFHIVFSSKREERGEAELGICNQRGDAVMKAGDGTHSWFMARFLLTESDFSAVMKAEDPSKVTPYVKKFSLAKVLKIDATAA
jgi:hypothetical protein